MGVAIQHRRRYGSPRPALLGARGSRVRPADHARALIERSTLVIEPEHRLHGQRDPHGNHVAPATFQAGHTTAALDVLVERAVEVRPIDAGTAMPDPEAWGTP